MSIWNWWRAIDEALHPEVEVETRVAELEAKVLRIVRREFGQICSHCGFEAPAGNESWKVLMDHIKECPVHPLREAESRAASLQEERDRLAARVERLSAENSRALKLASRAATMREAYLAFIADWEEYIEGKPEMPFSLLRHSLEIFLEACDAALSAPSEDTVTVPREAYLEFVSKLGGDSHPP